MIIAKSILAAFGRPVQSIPEKPLRISGFKPGQRVIVRNSHRHESYKTGTIIETDALLYLAESGRSVPVIPLVRFDEDGKDYTCMGVVLPWSTEMESAMSKLTPSEQVTLCFKGRIG